MTCVGGALRRPLPCDELACPLPLAPDDGPAAALLDDPLALDLALALPLALACGCLPCERHPQP